MIMTLKRTLDRYKRKIKRLYIKIKKDYLVNFVSVMINEIYINYIFIFYYNYKLY